MRRYLVQTFGCQMNAHDSERIEDVLLDHGYERTDDSSLADLVVINTCSVREKAEHKLMSLLGTLRPLKEARRDVVIAVAGCVAQQEGRALLEKARHLDVVIGPDNIAELPDLVESVLAGGPPISRTVFDLDEPRFLAPSSRDAGPGAYVTIMKGCDERCTFCIVPTTRGSERYRAAAEIVAEIDGLVSRGVREVTLLGQTVNSWYEPGREKGGAGGTESEFASLLRRIAAEVPALARLRYTSPHPRHLTDELIEAHRDLDVLPSHVHLPVQSGSDRVLRRMKRRYTRAEYIARTARLAASRPGFTLSTDFIVGFPGETEAEFEETLSLVRDVGFVAAFAFKYSPRPHTPALKLGDDVPEEVKDDRLARLFALVEIQQSAHLERLVDTKVRVLLDAPSRTDASRITGRSERHEIVHVEAEGFGPGDIVDAVVERANKHSLLAKAIGGAPRVRARSMRLPVLDGGPA
jgi:tRNA-2-methylthio-N6-dimethylallyladenosine synthase